MNDNNKSDLRQFRMDLWSSRVKAPPAVFDALFEDHEARMNAIITLRVEASEGELLNTLGAQLMNGQNDWYIGPALKTAQIFDKLSNGFALAAGDMAALFGDMYIGKDIRDALLDPETPPVDFVATTGNAAMHFIKAVKKYMGEDIWTTNEDLTDIELVLDFVGSFPPSPEIMEQQTPLMNLFYAQRLARVMLLIADNLRENGHPNLATIALALAEKSLSMSDDIILKVSQSNDAGRPISLKNQVPAPL